MKTLKYIISGIVILTMTLGSFTNISGQDVILFSETYKSKEIISLLDSGDESFSLLKQDKVDPESSRLGSCSEDEAEELWRYLQSAEVQNRVPRDLSFAWGRKSEAGERTLFALRTSRHPAPEQKDLETVSVQEDSERGSSDLLITFTQQGAEKWARMTGENVGRNIAIVIEGKVVMAPKVQMEITEGKCRISGDFSNTEAGEIKALLEN